MASNLPQETQAAIEALLFKGDKIAAIKLYRSSARCELVEAKSAVDSMEATLRSTVPARFAVPPARAGCLGVVALCVVVVVALILWVVVR